LGQIRNEEILCSSVDDVLSRLGSSQSGLTSEQAEKALETYGRNEVARKEKKAAIVEFIFRFRNPLVLILLIAGIISGLFGETLNAIIIFAIIMMSVVLDFLQESKAEKAAEELKEMVATTTTVLRDGAKKEIKLSEVVPGDITLLSAGDLVPADARMISSKDFFVDQAALTGESFPVEKTPTPVKPECVANATDWSDYLFMGTSVVSGSATAVVVKTGGFTEYGRIVKRIVERRPETEFERGLRRFGYMIMEVTFLLVFFVFIGRVFFLRTVDTRAVLESLLFAVALAVGLTPELLPMILSINLSKGAIAMSKKGVIVKRLTSIQNLGSMDVLCTDKTGTLTENKVTLILHIDLEGNNNRKVLQHSFLNSHYQTGLRSPLDEAILEHKEVDIKDYQKVDEIPFDFTRRRVSVVVEHEGERLLITKGAPEEIIKVCSFHEFDEKILDITSEIHRKIEQKYYDLSSEGFRVLGICYKRVRVEKLVYSVNDENDMVFLGFVAFMDPPKETAKESLQLLKKYGIELKIVTGDNELVTRKVCEQLGFEIKEVVLGSDLANMGDDALARVVEEANIFARVTPAQKDRIINALKSNRHSVGFLGDGINDAPSMKVADVSISVDNAVDVAKESADIILLHKDLTVLGQGILEGRKTFGNTMKYVLMGVSSNFGNMVSAAGASLFLSFLPMLPIQILLNNLLYDLSQSTIPTDNVDPEYIEKPKRLDVAFIRNYMIYFGPISSIFDFLTFYIMLYVFNAWNNAPLFQTAWFIESLCTQTLVIFAIRTRRSPFYRSKPSLPLLASSMIVVAAAVLLPISPVGDWFQFEDPSITFFVFLVAFVGAYLTMVEALKILFYRRHAYRLEHVIVPPKALLYPTPTARVTQNVIAVICLRFEDETSMDSLMNDLRAGISYPLHSDQVTEALHHLRRAGLVDIDWRNGIVKRRKAIADYISKYTSKEDWPKITQDWQRIGSQIQARHGRINPEYQRLMSQAR